MNAKLFLAAPLIALAFAGCAELLGLNDDYKASSGGSACAPGALQDCVAEAGSCHAGKQVCNPDGTGFGECIAVLAPPDGGACTCTPGTTIPCYDGDPATLGSTVCHAGTATCNSKGTAFGACEGQVLCTGQLAWAEMFGDTQWQEGIAIAADQDGNVIVVGSIAGIVPFGDAGASGPGSDGGADLDIFVLKLGPDGNLRWIKRFGDSVNQYATSVAVDKKDGSIVVVGIAAGIVKFEGVVKMPANPGGMDNDVFVLKLNADGTLNWVQRFGDGNEQYPDGVAVDGSGNIVVSGTFGGKVDFSTGQGKELPVAQGFDAFVAAFDPQGNHLWSRPFGGAGEAFGYAVAVDEGGNAFVAGEFGGPIDPLDGLPPRQAQGTGDAFLAKLDAKDGHTVWFDHFGGPSATAYGTGVAFDPKNQHVVFAGSFRGEIDIGANHLKSGGQGDSNIFLAAHDSMTETTIHFAAAFGDGTAEQISSGVAVDGDGNIVLSANVGGTVNFGGKDLDGGAQDKAFAKLDPSGKHLYSRRFGGKLACAWGAGFCQDVTVDKDGNILLTGGYQGVSDFGGGKVYIPKGIMSDIAVAKFSP